MFGIWLLLRSLLGRCIGLVIGGLFGAAVFSVVLGLVLLPYSLLGLTVAGIGILGFSPFATAFVIVRNAVQATQIAVERRSRTRLVITTVVGLLLFLSVPVTLQLETNRRIKQVIENTTLNPSERNRDAISVLQDINCLVGEVNLDRVAEAYERETNPARKEYLAKSYQDVTGKEVEARIAAIKHPD